MVGILLAAGQSRRFGSNKLLHPVQATPMLMVSAKKLVNELPDSVVVISDALQQYQSQLEQLGLRVVVNEQAEQGMGGSIACGVDASQYASGWVIALADMPYIRQDTIRLLTQRLKNGAAIVAPLYQQQRGHPAGFSQQFKQELLALDQDTGARQIIARHQQQLELLAIDDIGVISDIDEPNDIRA